MRLEPVLQNIRSLLWEVMQKLKSTLSRAQHFSLGALTHVFAEDLPGRAKDAKVQASLAEPAEPLSLGMHASDKGSFDK